jgi:hypothetical protein
MSGRSAYVRKKNNQVVKDRVPGRRAPSQQGSYSLSYGESSSAAQSTSYQNATFHRQRSGTSISSGSEADQQSRRPTLLPLESGIEKSALRSFMDSKSDKLRNKLASTITGSAPRTDDPSPVRPGSAASPDRSFEPSTVASPIPVPNAHRPRLQQHESSYDMGHRGHRGGSADLGPLVKRWGGSGRLPQPWNKLRKVNRVWTLPLEIRTLTAGRTRSCGIRLVILWYILVTKLIKALALRRPFEFPPRSSKKRSLHS